MRLRRSRHSMPELNTASLPDLIFTVLFFFMIITHMRENDVRVRYTQPSGTSLTRVGHRSSVVRLYIGREPGAADYSLQADNQLLSLAELPSYINSVREQMPADIAQHLTICIKADREAPMSLITQVKQALREAGATRVVYSAFEAPAAQSAEKK